MENKGEDKNGHKINEKGDIIFDDRCNNCDAPKAEVSECLSKAVEECIGIRGEKAYDGSYAAPREAFMKVLARVRNQALEEAANKAQDVIYAHNFDALGDIVATTIRSLKK